MLLLGLLGIVGVYRTNHAVVQVVDRVAPAQSANQALLQAVTDQETGLRGWALNGADAALAPYRDGMARQPEIVADLREHVDFDHELEPLIDRQDELAKKWVKVYAEPRLADGHGRDGYDVQRFVDGKALIDELREVNARVDSKLEQEAAAARDLGRRAYRRAILVVIVVTLLAGLLGWILVRRLRRDLQEPLKDLERTVALLAAGDAGARAALGGPREVSAVAVAVNRMAEENERAQQVEEATHARLLDLDQAKTDFVSNVSHELRTPLTSIQGYLELLHDEYDEVPGADRKWEVVNRNVKRLGVLIEDLLTLAHMESRHTTLTEVDLATVVEEVVVDLRIAAANKGVTISVDLPARAPFVLADKIQLLRALLNIVTNAVKFSRAGGKVDIQLRKEGDEAVLTIRDDGIGIPASELANLGSRFFRASNAVQMEISGTGLGVRMVQTIIEKHGGNVTFDSAENEFTLVTVRLPMRHQAVWHGDEAGHDETGGTPEVEPREQV
nr:ATP-binding protein [Nocardioides daedukensis]